MPNPANDIRIVQKRFIDRADYDAIRALQNLCESADEIALKLELDYKLAEAQNNHGDDHDRNVSEFLYYLNGTLTGYLCICGFGGESGPLELTGMAHPGLRRRGIFKALSTLAAEECRRRNTAVVLGLCDRKAEAGQALVKKQNAALHHSEYEMIMRNKAKEPDEALLRGVMLRKAKNADAEEIARQDRIYFADASGHDSDEEQSVRMPEEEEKRGFSIFLAIKDGQTIGKVNLQLIHGEGGIYGLGVLPNERGKGYGRAILVLAVQKLREAKAETIFLQVLTDNEKALRLYRSCGFETKSVMDYFKLPYE